MPTLLNANKYHYRRGGAEVVYLEQAEMFRSAGWNVVDFSMHHPDNDPSPWSEHFVDEMELGHDYPVAVKARMSGRVIFSRHAQRRLERLLSEAEPDIAHLHNVYHQMSPSILRTLRSAGVPTVLTTHDLKLACPAYQMLTDGSVCERCRGGRLHNVVRHRCVKGSLALSGVIFAESVLHRALKTYATCTDRFVAPSRFYIDTFVNWGYDRSQFSHVPNFVDPTQFLPGEQVGHGVVYVGRLAPEKGLATLIRAVTAAGVPLRVVGTGPEEPSLRALVAELGAPVEFVGYLTGAELHDEMRSARAMVLPSEWYENGPVSVLESYALATPVVVARIGGLPELVRDGETGLTHESGSVDDLADALRRLVALSDDDVVEMGRAGRAWVEEDFTPQHYLDRLLGVYAELGVAA